VGRCVREGVGARERGCERLLWREPTIVLVDEGRVVSENEGHDSNAEEESEGKKGGTKR